MPSTLESQEQARTEADVPCCPPEPKVTATPRPVNLAEVIARLEVPVALDQHDLELLCGVER